MPELELPEEEKTEEQGTPTLEVDIDDHIGVDLPTEYPSFEGLRDLPDAHCTFERNKSVVDVAH